MELIWNRRRPFVCWSSRSRKFLDVLHYYDWVTFIHRGPRRFNIFSLLPLRSIFVECLYWLVQDSTTAGKGRSDTRRPRSGIHVEEVCVVVAVAGTKTDSIYKMNWIRAPLWGDFFNFSSVLSVHATTVHWCLVILLVKGILLSCSRPPWLNICRVHFYAGNVIIFCNNVDVPDALP